MKPSMIRARTALVVLVLAGCGSARQAGQPSAPVAVSSTAATAGRPAAPDDVISMDAIISALYDVISGPKGQGRDWDRMRSLFHADARLIPTGRDAAGQHVVRPMTVEDYIRDSGTFLEEIGFREEELVRHVDRFGNIAQVFSSYAAYRDEQDEPFLRGINSIQLYHDDTRWWILNVFWEPERPGTALPPEYERTGARAVETRADESPSAKDASYGTTVRDGYEVHAPGDADLARTIEEVDYALARFERHFGDAPYIAVTLFEGPSEMMAFDLGGLHARGVPHLAWFLEGREPPSLEGARALSHEVCHTLFIHRIRRRSGWTPPAAPPGPEEVRYGAEDVPDWLDEAAALLCEFPALQERRRAHLSERTPLPLDSLFAMEHPSLPTLRRMLARAQSESGVAVGSHTAPPSTDPLLFYAQAQSVATFLIEGADSRIMAGSRTRSRAVPPWSRRSPRSRRCPIPSRISRRRGAAGSRIVDSSAITTGEGGPMSRSVAWLAVVAVLHSGCGSNDTGESREAAISVPDAVRDELVQLGVEDQAAREEFTPDKVQDSAFVAMMLRADSARTRRLRQIVDGYGWPTPAAVGPEAANAAFLILQHSPEHEFQKSMVPLLEDLAREGSMPPSDVAMLVDRVLVQEGNQQRYGTQFSIENGELVMHPVEDEGELDARRRQMQLPPMEEYKRLLEAHYQAPVSERDGAR